MSKPQSGIYGSIRMNKQKYLDEFKRLYDEGLNDSEIARRLGVNNVTISSWRNKAGLPKNFEYKRKFDKDEFMRLYKQGMNYSEIARELGVSNSAIQEYGSSIGLDTNYHKYEETEFTDEEFQVFLGTIYGDAYLRQPHNNENSNGHFAHSLKQEGYCRWKYEKLKRFCSEPRYEKEFDKRTEKIYESIRVRILSNPLFTKYYPLIYDSNKIKYINKDLFSKIEPLGLAVLFMDDGFGHEGGGFYISTNCFTEEDINIISNVLYEKFDLHTNMHRSHTLYISAKDHDKFISLVKPHIHSDCLYKLEVKNSVSKTPLNGETPELELDNPVLNPQEIEENAERLEVMPNE